MSAATSQYLLDIGFWSVLFFGSAWLVFCMVYTLLLFADLQVDHINPVELCERVNQLRLPEYASHTILCMILLVRGRFFSVVLNLPVLVWHVRMVMDKAYLLDNTSIFVTLPKETRHCEIKLGFFLVMFLYYLFRNSLALAVPAFAASALAPACTATLSNPHPDTDPFCDPTLTFINLPS